MCVVIGLTVFCFHSTFAKGEILRNPGALTFSEVAPGGWSLSLQDIVVAPSYFAEDGANKSWRFARIAMGVVGEGSSFHFEIHDQKGVILVEFLKRGDLIFIRPSGAEGYEPILFSVLRPSESGDEDTGRNGENIHQKMDIQIPGLKVMRAQSLRMSGYSLLLPAPAEEIFANGITENKLTPELVAKMKESSDNDLRDISVDKSVDRSIDVEVAKKPNRLVAGFLRVCSSIARAIGF